MYNVSLSGSTCTITATTYTDYKDEYDYVTWPHYIYNGYYDYEPISRNVSNWRTETSGCIEERSTYEITDYNNVNFNRALDLNLDLVPTNDRDTRWRPQYPDVIYERALQSYYDSNALFTVPKVTSFYTFFKPTYEPGLVACPSPARKLATMTQAQVDTYIDSLQPLGATYHDIGMIWGGRLISPTGLFASENANVNGSPTSRNLIFLTDGETAPMDIAYGAYGVEPLDQRRWTLDSPIDLTTTVEKRFAVACQEVKRRNITIWVISFGVGTTQLMRDCSSDNRVFQADNAEQLNNAFTQIVKGIGDLRVTK